MSFAILASLALLTPAKAAFIPALPIIQTELVQIKMTASEYKNQKFVFRIVEDGKHRPIGVDYDLRDLQNKNIQRIRPLSLLELAKGVTLFGTGNLDLVKIKTTQINSSTVGVQLTLLSNVYFNLTTTRNFLLTREKNQWHLKDSLGTVDHLLVTSNSMGISEIKR